MPKFTVRAGFVVHFVERVKQTVAGQEKVVEREQTYYPEDQAFELTEGRAREHAHKLVPEDKAASKLLEDMAVVVQQPAAAGPAVDVAAIAAAASQATIAALVQAGVIKAAPEAAATGAAKS